MLSHLRRPQCSSDAVQTSPLAKSAFFFFTQTKIFSSVKNAFVWKGQRANQVNNEQNQLGALGFWPDFQPCSRVVDNILNLSVTFSEKDVGNASGLQFLQIMDSKGWMSRDLFPWKEITIGIPIQYLVLIRYEKCIACKIRCMLGCTELTAVLMCHRSHPWQKYSYISELSFSTGFPVELYHK